MIYMNRVIRSYFHEVTVVRKIRTQIGCDFHSLDFVKIGDDLLKSLIPKGAKSTFDEN